MSTTSKSSKANDPIGAAVEFYSRDKISRPIIVQSDILQDDIIDSQYLFRSFEDMPEVEKIALERCAGKVIDIGCGAGPHLNYLNENKIDVLGIDTSPGCISFLNRSGYKVKLMNFTELKDERFDTILMLMNGIGLAGELKNLDDTLIHLRNLLNENGRILLDSTDVKYVFEDADGSYWTDLNSDYYGNFKFKMKFQEEESPWFSWLYVDFETLQKHAASCNLACQKIHEEDDHFLAELKII